MKTGRKKCITASIPGRQVALIAYNGWDSVQSQVHRGFNAEAEESTVLFAYRKRTPKNPPMELMISVMLHKTDDTAWTKEELSPLKDIKLMDVIPRVRFLVPKSLWPTARSRLLISTKWTVTKPADHQSPSNVCCHILE